MASSPTGAIAGNEDTSSSSDEDDIGEEDENVVKVEARIATLLTQV